MRCDILTLFPAPVEAYLTVGVLGRGCVSGVLDVRVHDLRRWATNRYGQVDDEPYGGGPGMVLMAPVVLRAVREVAAMNAVQPRVVLPDPRGRRFDDRIAQELAACPRLLVLCGRYEGFDERVHASLGADEISLGDFVLSGGELAALAILDAAVRHVPGVVGDSGSVEADSFTSGLLDHPVYTRPQVFEGEEVPEVLLSGHHEHVRRWRQREAIRLTLRRRRDILEARWDGLADELRGVVSEVAEEENIPWPPSSPKPT